MPTPERGKFFLSKRKINELGTELKQWMLTHDDEWQIEKFSTQKGIPYHHFTTEFPQKSLYFREIMSLCEDLKRIRFTQQVKDKIIPPTFAIFASKNELDYRDRQPSDDKKKKDVPASKDQVKGSIAKAKEKLFSKPE